MNMRIDKKISTALAVSIFSMLISMILATRIIKSNAFLTIFYAISFLIQFLYIIYVINNKGIKLHKNSLYLIIVFFIILMLPMVNCLIFDIKINFFDPINSIIKIINFFTFFCIIQCITIDEQEIARFMKIIVYCSIIACIFSLLTETNDILSIGAITNTNSLGIRSFFSNRNQYSSFLVIAFIANIYLNRINKQKYCLFTFILQVLCILTTFSRSAFFSIFIITILIVLFETKLTKRKVVLLFLFFIIIIAIMLSTGVFEYIEKNYIRWEVSGDSGRFTLWNYAWNIAKYNILTGVGFYTGVDIAMSFGMGLTQFHSMFFDFLVDGGLFEIGFIIFVIYYVCKSCLKKCSNKRLSRIYVASLCGFFFHACFESLSIFALSYSDMLYTIFFISIPILLSNIKKKNS